MTPDEDLMLQYQAGEASAFDILYEKYRGDLYRFLLRQFDPATAEELYQDVWMKLIRARDSYRPSASFRTWLYSIAHNRIRDHYRRQHTGASVDDDCEVDTRAPDRIAQHRQALAVLQQGIRRLPPEQREAFLLKEESGLSVDDIAAVMGASRESTRSRLRYAVRKLREQLEGIWP